MYTESMNTALYAAMSHADQLVMAPESMLWLQGYYGEALYIKDLLDMIGVRGNFLTMGDYKSAAEMLTRSGPSEPAEENLNRLFDGWYQATVERIAARRGLSKTQVRGLIDAGPFLAKQALDAGLIDGVATKADFLTGLKDAVAAAYGGEPWVQNRYREEKAKANFANPFALFASLFAGSAPEEDPAPVIGIVYVEGTIQPGHGQPSPFGGSGGAFSGDIAHALDLAAGDERVRAVVLRVNSPGGSALASEVILEAARRVQSQKPVVVSMGDVAASGGYYVSC